MTDKNFTNIAHTLSVVIPLHNEQENVEPLLEQIHKALDNYNHPWELIIVDDGSTDDTFSLLQKKAPDYGDHVRSIELQRNFGQTAAMQTGIDAARGDVIVTMDGDLQNDPRDIPRMVTRLLVEDLDLVAGWRKNRKDKLIMRKLPSRLANKLIAEVTGVYLHDYGCSLKAFRANVIKDVRLYGEMHRFIPAWIATHTKPTRIKEEIVEHHSRQFGESKYGISRTFRVILDLVVVYFFLQYRSRPGHFFGKFGFIVGGIGSLALGYLFILKLMGEEIGTRPLLFFGILCVLMAVQLLTTGVLSEMLSRIYYESGNNLSYTVRNKSVLDIDADTCWKKNINKMSQEQKAS